MMARLGRRSPIAACTALVFLHATLYSTLAFAADGRTVACFVLAKKPADLQAAAVMSSILRDHAGKLIGVTVRTGAPPGNAQAGIEAERLANEGFAALNTGDKVNALAGFKKAWDVLAQNPGTGSVRLHARVAKGLGVAQFMNGETTAGKDLIKRSLLLHTEQAPNEYAYSVEVRNLYEFAKREIAEMAQGTIEVRSTPEAAETYLDGVFKGYSPISLTNVPTGKHLVEVVKDGYLRWSTDVAVGEGARVTTEAVLTDSPVQKDLERAVEQVKKTVRTPKFGPAAEGLMRIVDANEALVLFASIGKEGFRLEGSYRDLAGTVQPVQETLAQDADFFKNIRSLLSGTLAAAFQPEGKGDALDSPPPALVDSVMKQVGSVGGDIAIDPDSPLFKISDGDKGDSITKKWWFWTIIGVGTAAIAGTVVGVVLATSEKEEDKGAVGSLSITFERFGN